MFKAEHFSRPIHALQLIVLCTVFPSMHVLAVDNSSEQKGASKPIIELLKRASEKSSLVKGYLEGADLNKVLDPSNTREETCDKKGEEYVWTITALADESISLMQCQVRYEHIHARVHKYRNGNELLVIASEQGDHGQNWEFEYFDFDPRSKKLTPRTQESIGIITPRENEFLTKHQKLKPSENNRTFLRMNEDGTIEASPSTWMEKRWENRTPAYKIVFKWNGSSFSKRITTQP